MYEPDKVYITTFGGAFFGESEPKLSAGNRVTGSYLDWDLGEDSTYYTEGLSRFCSIVMGMQKIHATVEFKSEIDVYYACRAMESVCRQKDLVLRLVDLNDSHEEVPEDSVLQACTILRC